MNFKIKENLFIMETEILSEDCFDVDKLSNSGVNKISFSAIRIVVCAAILLVLALFKYFNVKIYNDFGKWYELNFKAETISAENLKNYAQNKIATVQETMKNKINSL